MQKGTGASLDLGASPQTPGIFSRHGSLSSDEDQGGEAQLHAPFSSCDELTRLFLSAVASPQSRPPLHPVRSPYKPPDPAQVFFESDTTQHFFYSPCVRSRNDASRRRTM